MYILDSGIWPGGGDYTPYYGIHYCFLYQFPAWLFPEPDGSIQ